MDINKRLNCKEVKGWDLVDFLSGICFEPKEIRRNDYWYLSPLRIEKSPSFKIARKLNVWNDHGIGKGGTVIDFCFLYFNCSVEQALEKMADTFSFHRPVYQPQNQPHKKEDSPLHMLRVGPIQSFPLVRYLHCRNLSLEIVRQYNTSRKYTAMALEADKG